VADRPAIADVRDIAVLAVQLAEIYISSYTEKF